MAKAKTKTVTATPTGRPTKLTPEVQAGIVALVQAGNFQDAAADAVGIGARTLRTWMALGEAEPESIHGNFRHAVLEAEARAEFEMVQLVRLGAVSDPKHAEWWLERKRRDRWGRQVEVTGPGGGPIAAEVKAEVEVKGEPKHIAGILGLLGRVGALPVGGGLGGVVAADDAEGDEVHPPRSDDSAGGVPSP